jgi:hypothetical protein
MASIRIPLEQIDSINMADETDNSNGTTTIVLKNSQWIYVKPEFCIIIVDDCHRQFALIEM